MVRVGVCGAAGRMGKTIIEVCDASDGASLGAAIEHPDSPALGQDAGLLAGQVNVVSRSLPTSIRLLMTLMS